VSSIAGVDRAGVEAWLAQRVPGAEGLSFQRLAGGRSNLTYLVADAAGRRWVLRRPPLGAVAATAHDVLREARILQGLQDSAVPVPRVIATCSDPAVTGAPFVLMEFIDGVTCRSPQALEPQARAIASGALADGLATLHAQDVDALGLGDLGRRTGYVERQLARWHAQWESGRTRVLERIEQTWELLRHRVPAQRRTALVHGDYRLDNCILRPDGQLAAVVDWEIATLGDPLADLALLLVYWARPGDPVSALEDPPTLAEGFAPREALRERYLATAGGDATDLDFHIAFAWWKLACIVEGVYARIVQGAMPVTDRPAASFAAQAQRLADQAFACAGALPRRSAA
jgi:aminoglycoside phosphotransferase (APT) family kinase protein